MKALKVKKQNGQSVRRKMIISGLLSKEHEVKTDDDYLYLPLVGVPDNVPDGSEIVDLEFDKYESRDVKLKDVLAEKLTAGELELAKTAFDVVGDIAILEIDPPLVPKAKYFAEFILKSKPNIKTVLRKNGAHDGEFRTQGMDFIAGEDKRLTIHRENGVRLYIDVEQVYFSPRSANERKRIYKLVRPKEEVLVMFSGAGPYTIEIAKNTSAKSVTGIEINPKGHELAEKNKTLNKVDNVTNINGDVKKAIPEISKKFDRVMMPLPKTADEFLDVAVSALKGGGMMHFYDFLHEDNFSEAEDKVKEAAEKAGRKAEIKGVYKSGSQSPRIFRICVDARIK